MKAFTTNQCREMFLNYFIERQHTLVPSSSLVPHNDPTLLFTNAGMVQFKETFLGVEQRAYCRATSSQRCVRAGGKHNDLEQVGYTKRHHTFFEMLGNFSFGDYFKVEAIEFAWTFLTDVLAIPQEKLWVTVFHEDQESEAIWRDQMGVPAARIVRCGEADNFWSMGDTGPCGPCTEIFYDHGSSVAGGPPGSAEQEGDRYVEIWNLVFMQFNRNASGQMTPLPKPCVDTGMGLERIAAVLQGVHDNYDIDLFVSLRAAAAQAVAVDDAEQNSVKVIADHIRSVSFLILDGVTPSNEGRGYVLRRIIRRAIRHGYQLGQTQAFFSTLVPTLVALMGEAYPELIRQQAMIEKVISREEQQFSGTLVQGMKILIQNLEQLQGSQLPGDVVFLLYDTFGFPPDLTADVARERGVTIDSARFEACMTQQRQQSRQGQHFAVDVTQQFQLTGETKFTGYEAVEQRTQVTHVLGVEGECSLLKAGEAGVIVLAETPFYAESGGQVGDTGLICGEQSAFQVQDTRKKGSLYLHHGVMQSGELKPGDSVQATVSADRDAIRANHSATHLLHAALRQHLGEQVAQKGSLVAATHLRFDFSHPEPLTAEQLAAIEQTVNAAIRQNAEVTTQQGSLDQAREAGAIALFGEKYAAEVRIVKMGSASHEVCGGTHVRRTGDIGLFKITTETACAAGIRRIEAVTAAKAVEWVQQHISLLRQSAYTLKTSSVQLPGKVEQLLADGKRVEKELTQVKQQIANQQSQQLDQQARLISGVNVLAVTVATTERDALRQTVDQLKGRLQSAAIVLAAVQDNKITLVAGVTKDCLTHFTAGDLLQQVASQVGGRGGGRSDFAQGGGTQPENLPAALASVHAWVEKKLQAVNT